jgi:hypothetical protein
MTNSLKNTLAGIKIIKNIGNHNSYYEMDSYYEMEYRK